LPHSDLLKTLLARRSLKIDELTNTPVSATAANGALMAWTMLDFFKDAFAIQTQVRKAMQLLLAKKPKSIAIVVLGDLAQRKLDTELAVYGAWMNSAQLPEH